VIAPARAPALLLAAFTAASLCAAAALALEGPPAAAVDDMDMGLLQRNLLKIYVSEKEASINAKLLDDYKVAVEISGTEKVTLQRPTEEQLSDMRKREREISFFLLFEKTDAVQMIRIVDKILGTESHLAGEGREARAFLDKQVELIEIPRGANGKGTDIREAAKIIGEVLGCPVKVEQPDTEIYRLWFTMGPATGETIIKQVCASQPFDWRFENGTLVFRHRDLAAGANGEGPKDENRKFDEEDRRRENEEKAAEAERKKNEKPK
jgi:hypothetical protein